MRQLRKIVMGYDFQPGGETARRTATVLAARCGAQVKLILRAAEEYDTDLMVMGTHGRTGLTHMLLGSIAEGVVRQAFCSVLTIRPDALQFALP